MRIADVVFDVPVPHPFSYRVPDAFTLGPGQRVRAPLHGGPRVGLVVAVRAGSDAGLKPLAAIIDPTPVLSSAQLDLAGWIATQSLSTLGSTCAALLPPPDDRGSVPPPEMESGRADSRRQLFVGHGRERRLLERIGAVTGPSLVLVPDIDAAARWATRLGKLGRVVRLDSGAADDERAAGWRALAEGRARLGVGTRSALLAPLAAGGLLALIDEHEPAHKPPGAPRIHTRDVVLERARRERVALALTSATPSVETWWRADARRLELAAAPAAAWPVVSVADTRGILRREPITPALARAMRDALAAGRRVFLGVSRLTAALACDECGGIVRCDTCVLALAYLRAAASLACRLCGSTQPLPELCPTCRGRRLSPFGWSPERVEHAVRRRFPKASVARYDPDARGAKVEAQRRAAAHAEIVVGTRSALKLFGPASLGAAGFVTADQLFRVPDFRASERAFAVLWAAAERVRPDGALVVQSQNPAHYALAALTRQDLGVFYKDEMKFRAELGYPPFRRLAIVTVRGKSTAEIAPLADAAATALRGNAQLTVYPATSDRRGRAHRIVVKGGDDLPVLLATALGEFHRPRKGSRGIMDVEVDPVEWPF
jgi:primosomal protein N' (replication factor Y)